MKRFLIAALALLAWTTAASAESQITVWKDKATFRQRVVFTTGHDVNTISDPIQTCSQMKFFWDRGAAAVVSVYEVGEQDDTFAEVEAGTLVQSTGSTPFTTDVAFGPYSPNRALMRAVVDTKETAGNSVLNVECLGASVGAAPRGDFDALPTNGAESPLFMVVDCADASCAAGGGSTWVLKFWNGVTWQNQSSGGSDNLGNHTATVDLDLAGNDLVNVGAIDAVPQARTLVELNSLLAAASLPQGASESVDVSVRLADSFTYDETSATPFTIQLPTGGGEHPQIRIDLNGHRIQNRAINTVELAFGNAGGTCALDVDAGYYNAPGGCPGVAHDYDVWLANGFISNDYGGCDGTPTASCGRRGVATVGTEYLWESGAGTNYGGRVHFLNLKVGGESGSTGSTAARELDLPDDACFSVGVPVTEIEIAGGQGDCFFGLTVPVDPYDDSNSFARVNLDWSYQLKGNYSGASATSCSACRGGLLNFLAPSPDAEVYGAVRLFGPLGNTRGGNFALSTQGYFIGATGTPTGACYHTNQTSESYFLDNGSQPDEPLSGWIEFAGMMCTRGWVRSSAVDSFRTTAVLREQTLGGQVYGLPGFLVTDTAATGHTKLPVLDASASGEIGAALFEFTPDPRPDSADIVYSQLLDADILSGAALRGSDARAYAWVDLGLDGHYGVVGAVSPTAYENKSGTSTGGGPGVDTTAIHNNVAGEILALTAKSAPTGSDLLMIEDVAAGNAKRRATLSSLPVTASQWRSGTTPSTQFMFIGPNSLLTAIDTTGSIIATHVQSGPDPSSGMGNGEVAVDTDGDGVGFAKPFFRAVYAAGTFFVPMMSSLPAGTSTSYARYNPSSDELVWVDEGKMRAPVSVVSTAPTLTLDDLKGSYLLATAAMTINLPSVAAASAGHNFCVQVRDVGETVAINPAAGDRIILYGTALADGAQANSPGGAGDMLCLMNDSIDGWISMGTSGVWTNGG